MKLRGHLLRRRATSSAVALIGVLGVMSFAPSAFADQRQSAENHRIAAECINTVNKPVFNSQNPLAMTATANRSLGCHNADIELIIYEQVNVWPDRVKARSGVEHFAVGNISASGLAGDHPQNYNPLYAYLTVNGEGVGQSAYTPSPHA